jgi:hypothetical protein
VGSSKAKLLLFPFISYSTYCNLKWPSIKIGKLTLSMNFPTSALSFFDSGLISSYFVTLATYMFISLLLKAPLNSSTSYYGLIANFMTLFYKKPILMLSIRVLSSYGDSFTKDLY